MPLLTVRPVALIALVARVAALCCAALLLATDIRRDFCCLDQRSKGCPTSPLPPAACVIATHPTVRAVGVRAAAIGAHT
eukprot:2385044-Prymnesium_polylepis.1